MNITGETLNHSNIVFLFEPVGFTPPSNNLFSSLYDGEKAVGSNFVDDPVLQIKVLQIPALKMIVTLEGARFRVDDDSGQRPDSTSLINEAYEAYFKLFREHKLKAMGFNFEVFYRFDNAIPMNFYFDAVFDKAIKENADLRDFGFQFTLDKANGKRLDVYSLKIAAPLEMAVSVNHHFMIEELPSKEKIQKMFERSFSEIEEVIRKIKM